MNFWDYLNHPMAYLIVWILLPVIPAFIFYKWLPPGKTFMSGPLQGFKVQLTGSFAGYFAILIVLSPAILPKLRDSRTIFTISGEIAFSDRQRNVSLSDVSLFVSPPIYSVEQGQLNMRLISEHNDAGRLELPMLHFGSSGYLTTTVDLEKKQLKFADHTTQDIKYTRVGNTIRIDGQIELRKATQPSKKQKAVKISG